MWQPLPNGEFTEVVVECHEYAVLGECTCENCRSPAFADGINIVAGPAKCTYSRSPDAGVEQQPHCGSLAYLGMNRSLHTML